MKTKMNASILEDRKVNVKVKLALLWVALMFLYVYNDIFVNVSTRSCGRSV